MTSRRSPLDLRQRLLRRPVAGHRPARRRGGRQRPVLRQARSRPATPTTAGRDASAAGASSAIGARRPWSSNVRLSATCQYSVGALTPSSARAGAATARRGRPRRAAAPRSSTTASRVSPIVLLPLYAPPNPCRSNVVRVASRTLLEGSGADDGERGGEGRRGGRRRARPGQALRGVEAVRGIDLDVARGETFGFLGPNGAGKSTTINILCTLAEPTAATAEVVAGFDVRARARPRCAATSGWCSRTRRSTPTCRGEQNLRFHRRALRRRPPPRAAPARGGAAHGGPLGAAGATPCTPTPAACGGGSRSPAGLLHSPPGALPRRADDRPRPADPRHHLGLRRAQLQPRAGGRSPSSSPPTTWTRPRTATGSRS